MALPASDSFTRADGELAAGSANWAKCSASSGNMSINGNAVQSASGNENGYLWAGDTFNGDHYSQVVISALTNVTFVGPACRVQNGTYSYYGYYGDGNLGAFPFKQVAGTWTQFGSTLGVFAVSDTIRIEASGTSITFKRNGSTDRTQTDSALSGGAAGITGQNNNAGSKLDTWQGDDLAGGGTNATANAGVAATTTTGRAATATGGASVTAAVAASLSTAYAVTSTGGAAVTAGRANSASVAYAAVASGGVTAVAGVAAATTTAYAATATGGATATAGLAQALAVAYAATASPFAILPIRAPLAHAGGLPAGWARGGGAGGGGTRPGGRRG